MLVVTICSNRVSCTVLWVYYMQVILRVCMYKSMCHLISSVCCVDTYFGIDHFYKYSCGHVTVQYNSISLNMLLMHNAYIRILAFNVIVVSHTSMLLICISVPLDSQKGMTPLMAAAQGSHLEAMEVLLTECNCNSNARDEVYCYVSCMFSTCTFLLQSIHGQYLLWRRLSLHIQLGLNLSSTYLYIN